MKRETSAMSVFFSELLNLWIMMWPYMLFAAFLISFCSRIRSKIICNITTYCLHTSVKMKHLSWQSQDEKV